MSPTKITIWRKIFNPRKAFAHKQGLRYHLKKDHKGEKSKHTLLGGVLNMTGWCGAWAGQEAPQPRKTSKEKNQGLKIKPESGPSMSRGRPLARSPRNRKKKAQTATSNVERTPDKMEFQAAQR